VDEFGELKVLSHGRYHRRNCRRYTDEYDEVRNPFEKKNDGSTLIDAAMSIAEFNAHFPKSIPEDSDYETLAGYLQKITGRLPEIKEEIRTTEYMFTILTKSARRLRQIKVSRLF